MERNFDEWFGNLKDTVYSNRHYTDFRITQQIVDRMEFELRMMDFLVRSEDLKKDFMTLMARSPEVRRCFPLIFASRGSEITVRKGEKDAAVFSSDIFCGIEDYALFMKESGLFDLIKDGKIRSFYDYALGVEVGIDSAKREYRRRQLKDAAVARHLIESGVEYYRKVSAGDVKRRWNIDVTHIWNPDKIFDFAAVRDGRVYAIDADIYIEGNPKLPDIAEAHKTAAIKSEKTDGFSYVWITDGRGWKGAKYNLLDVFRNMKHIYSVKDLEDGVIEKILGKRRTRSAGSA
jgi:type II restriction enzyme